MLGLSVLATGQVSGDLMGDVQCPCLPEVTVAPWTMSTEASDAFASANPDIDVTTYGVGCKPHDINARYCTEPLPATCDNTVPVPPWCQRPAWCPRSWCYVDPAAVNAFPSRLPPRAAPATISAPMPSVLAPHLFHPPAVQIDGPTKRLFCRHGAHLLVRNLHRA